MNEPKIVTRSAAGYHDDFHAWSAEQAARLREFQPRNIDWENVAEEIESLGRSDQREVTSRLTTLLVHLLKWRYQSKLRADSWSDTIARERIELPLILDQSPSLARFAEATFAKAHRLARREASRQTRLGLHTFPEESPFSLRDALDPDFWPESDERR
jgi:hypothetical protein